MPKNRILHLEDNEDDALLIRRALERGGVKADITVVGDAGSYRQALASSGFDVILSDSRVPGFSGLIALQEARLNHPQIPFICVSGAMDEKTIETLVAGGVTQCILKGAPAQISAAVQQALDLQAARQQAQKLTRIQEGSNRLISAVQELSYARDLATIREIVRHAARELTGADGATLVLRDGDYCHYVDEDAISPLWKGRRFPLETCISGWAMLNRQAVAIEDIYSDSRIPADAYRPTFVKSLLMVPIRTDNPLGAIGNYWAASHRVQPWEMELLQALANTTAVALENVRVYSELEQRVHERTLQLEAANRELESFSFSVSHDLRSPLHTISGYAELIDENYGPKLDDTCKGFLTRIRQQTDRMGNLINDFIRLAQIRTTEIQTKPVNLSRLSDGIIETLRAGSPGRSVCFVRPENLTALGDPQLLQVALENLLSNAWKYTGKIQGEARIELGATAGAKNTTIFHVRDNGAGFDPRYADKLFTPFQRLHSSKDFPGSGVGLATVQRIMHKHGGRIWAESEPNKGATFSFTLAPDPV